MSENCSDYIYSNEYAEFTEDYRYNVENIINRFNPVCINQITRRYYTAFKKIEDIISMPITEYGYAAFPKVYGLLQDNVLDEIGVNQLRRIPGFDFDGTNVIFGIVDTGISYDLDVFRYEGGETRILSIWDQTTYEGGDYAYANYGRVYSREEIDEALQENNPYDYVKQNDEVGHGTALSALAAGGLNRENRFIGVAPNSDIVVVKLKTAKPYLKDYYGIQMDTLCYQDNDIMAGIQFLLDQANKVNKPIVICLAVGTNLGSHDGRDNLSQYIDDISRNSGIAVVVATGNEVAARHHYEGIITLDDSSNVERMEINVGENVEGFTLEVWIEAPNTASISIKSPTGQESGIINMRQNNSEVLSYLFDRTLIYVDMKSIEENTGNALICARFRTPLAGIWTIDVYKEAKIEGKFGAWLPLRGLVDSSVYFINSNPYTTLISIANSYYSIAIGGYNSVSGGVYVNSSRGYTFDNRIKPDLVAPAVEVISPNGRGDYSPKTGTSNAAALTTGTVILLFQWADSVNYWKNNIEKNIFLTL